MGKPSEEQYRQYAQEAIVNDDLQINDKAQVSISTVGKAGAWIQAWVWMNADDVIDRFNNSLPESKAVGIDVFKISTDLSDGSKVFDVEMAVDNQGNTIRMSCHDEDHANRLVAVISECLDVEPN